MGWVIGGTADAVLGAGLADLLVHVVGHLPLLLISVGFLELGVHRISPDYS